jgi:tetratricopeptide (TPR) repeat protein
MKRLIILVVLAAAASYCIWNLVQQNRENTWQGEMEKALSAHAMRHEGDAEEILRGMLPQAERWWPNGPHLVETLSWLGTIYRGELKYDLAEPLLERAVQLSEQQGSASTTALGRAKLNLGIIARDQSDDVKAEKLFSEAAEIFAKDPQAACGDDDAALLNLGFLAKKRVVIRKPSRI